MSVMTVFGAYPAEQVVPQLMPAGVLTTVPPVVAVTVRVTGGRKLAVTVAAEVPSVIVQVAPLVEVQPVQLPKVELPVAAAVSVTTVDGA